MVTISSTPTFSTGWCILGSSCAKHDGNNGKDLREYGHDLTRESGLRLLIVGAARYGDYEVVDPHLHQRLQLLRHHLRGAYVRRRSAGRRYLRLAGVLFFLDQLNRHRGRLDDLFVITPDLLAVSLEHLSLVAHRPGIAYHVTGIAPLSHHPECHLLSTTAYPQRWVGLLHSLGLVYGLVYGIVLAAELGVVLRPHIVDDLASLAQHPHPITRLGEVVAVSLPLVLVPAGSDPRVEPALACHVHGGGHLRVQRGVAVAVAAHHLPDLHPLGVPRERGGDSPALEGGLKLGSWDGVKMVEHPYGVPPLFLVCRLRRPGHGLIFLDRVYYLSQIHAPTLWHKDPEPDRHVSPSFLTRAGPGSS